MGQLTRRHFIQATTGALVASAIPRLAVAAPAGKSSIRLGVTLYSYTGDYARATVLQDCIADAAATGSEGIELLSKTHIPDYPNPSDEWIDRWGSLVRDHRMAPSCYDCCESELSATGSEHSLRHLIRYLELASRLGFKIIRPAWGVPKAGAPGWGELARQVLPYAGRYDVRIAPEIRSSALLNSAMVQDYLDLMVKRNAKTLGLLIDMGRFEAENDDPKALRPFVPFLAHVRGTFLGSYVFNSERMYWEEVSDAQHRGIPFETALPMLIEAGYEGYISSEYDGPRSTFMASGYLSRRHLDLSRLLRERRDSVA